MEEYADWSESEAAELIARGRIDTDSVRELLILECHSSALARSFFDERLTSEELLVVLLTIAIDDYSGDAQMNASYWASRFPIQLLSPRVHELEAVAANEWESVSVHAKTALAAISKATT